VVVSVAVANGRWGGVGGRIKLSRPKGHSGNSTKDYANVWSSNGVEHLAIGNVFESILVL